MTPAFADRFAAGMPYEAPKLCETDTRNYIEGFGFEMRRIGAAG